MFVCSGLIYLSASLGFRTLDLSLAMLVRNLHSEIMLYIDCTSQALVS